MKVLKTILRKSVSFVLVAMLLTSAFGLSTVNAESRYTFFKAPLQRSLSNDVFVSVNRYSPRRQYVKAGVDDLKVFTVDFAAKTVEDIMIEDLKFTITGDVGIDQASLVDDSGMVLDSTYLQNGELNFRSIDYIVSKGEIATFSLYVDVSMYSVMPDTFYASISTASDVKISGMNSGEVLALNGSFPLRGGTMMIGGPKLDVYLSESTPASQYVSVGANDFEFLELTLSTENSYEDVGVDRMTFELSGRSMESLGEISLYVDGIKLSSSYLRSNNEVTFSNLYLVLDQGTVKNVSLHADVYSSQSRRVYFRGMLVDDSDVRATGQQSGEDADVAGAFTMLGSLMRVLN